MTMMGDRRFLSLAFLRSLVHRRQRMNAEENNDNNDNENDDENDDGDNDDDDVDGEIDDLECEFQ